MHVEVMEIFDRFMIDRSEGAMLKDLTSPYLPGNASRKKGHWLKLKPDYIDGEYITYIMSPLLARSREHSYRPSLSLPSLSLPLSLSLRDGRASRYACPGDVLW
tara:strand:+ start:280 stop:591 length:312 start_codon:yes stop_codon:yes gene_type:complete